MNKTKTVLFLRRAKGCAG